MKNASKIVCLLSCALLAGAFVFNWNNIVKGAAWVTINLLEPRHIVRLKELYLWTTDDSAWLSPSQNSNVLDIKNGLVVHGGTVNVSSSSQLVVIGWWDGNQIWALKSWIVWWDTNIIWSNDSVIGGWKQNTVLWDNGNWVIGWGDMNNAWDGGVVVGWHANSSSYTGTVVLWWYANVAEWENGLLMWTNARWATQAFSWSDGTETEWATEKSARIDASNGLLIGTYNKKDWINVVVNGYAQVGNRTVDTEFVSWEIMEKNGCFYAYDWEKWHIMWKNSTVSGCDDAALADTISKPCQFGWMKLQHGDKVTGYSKPYAVNCEEFKKENVECKWWQLVVGNAPTEYTYSYCYNITAAPTVDPSLLPEEGPVVTTASLRWNNPDMNDFTWEELTIWDYTIMDRNLWAKSAWNGTDTATVSSDFIWYHYQWWNNFWFDPNKTPSTSWTRGNRTDEWYPIFVISNPWYTNATESDEWAQWPCPDGWHIPTKDEWAGIVNAWRVENPTDYRGSERWSKFWKALKLPFAGYRNYNDAGVFSVGTFTDYWSSSTQDDENSYTLGLGRSYVDPEYVFQRSNAFPVRCFKD